MSDKNQDKHACDFLSVLLKGSAIIATVTSLRRFIRGVVQGRRETLRVSPYIARHNRTDLELRRGNIHSHVKRVCVQTSWESITRQE